MARIAMGGTAWNTAGGCDQRRVDRCGSAAVYFQCYPAAMPYRRRLAHPHVARPANHSWHRSIGPGRNGTFASKTSNVMPPGDRTRWEVGRYGGFGDMSDFVASQPTTPEKLSRCWRMSAALGFASCPPDPARSNPRYGGVWHGKFQPLPSPTPERNTKDLSLRQSARIFLRRRRLHPYGSALLPADSVLRILQDSKDSTCVIPSGW